MSKPVGIGEILQAVALGDALGYPLEFVKDPTALDFGILLKSTKLTCSDDTQMTLFLADAIANNKDHSQYKIVDMARLAYLRWYRTQVMPQDDAVMMGLLYFPELWHQRDPGMTCIASCQALHSGSVVNNDSKGNGTVMRCAPYAVWGIQRGDLELMDVAGAAYYDAKLTHKHSDAAYCSSLYVLLLMYLLMGEGLPDALNLVAKYTMSRSKYLHDLTHRLMDDMLNNSIVEYSVNSWTAYEALAVAVNACLTSDTFLQAVRKAAVIPGDSDTCASIAATISVCQGRALPTPTPKLDLQKPIDYVTAIW